MHKKIIKATIGAQLPGVLPTGYNPFGSSQLKSPIDDLGKMKAGAPQASSDFTKASKKNATKAANLNSTGNSMGMSSGLQSGLGAAGSLLGGLSSGNLTAEQSATREGIRSAISSAGPIGAIIGAASGVVDAIGAATGLNLDNLDTESAKRAGIGGAAGANNFLNSLPGVSMAVGMFAGKTAKSYKSAEIDELSNAYGGSSADIDAAQKLGGKRTLFGKNKANKFIREQNRVNELLTDIGLESKLRKSNSAADTYASQNQNAYSGYTPQLLLSKKGAKIPELEVARVLLNKFTQKPIKTDEPPKFKDGGKLNVIAEGSLHARKHDLEDINPELKGVITHKGIPVISHSEGGEIVQHAEIEGGELILNKDLTVKLEELFNDGSEDAMIKAGKLLTTAILRDTDDKTKSII